MLRRYLVSLAGLVATLSVTSPAMAIPFLGSVSASAGGGFLAPVGTGNTRPGGFVTSLAGQVDALGFDASASWLGSDNQTIMMEGLFRKELSFLPMISAKVGAGYLGQALLSSQSELQHLGQVRLDATFSPILLPIEAEASLGAASGLDFKPYLLGSAAVHFSFIPFIGVFGRVRAFGTQDLSTMSQAFELGLRAKL
ncbi:MAG: hypothetical protein VKP72_03120 [bacterium]|jgi:hypothetical protein|nr:hypothetical protein [bacterium]